MIKNKAHSIKARLLNLSVGDNKKYQRLVTRYLHERFLFRLSRSQFSNNFILKGGALLYVYEQYLPRPTWDVDFLGINICMDKNVIIRAFKDIVLIQINDGIKFIPETIEASTIGKNGIRITVVATLDTIRQKLIYDIGFGDIITPYPLIIDYSTIFAEDRFRLKAYSLETVISEKLQTIVEKGMNNSRMKDFFDLYRIILMNHFDEEILLMAIRITFQNRKTDLSAGALLFTPEFATDPSFQNRWIAFCKKIEINNPPSFEETVKTITDFIKPFLPKAKP